MFDDQSAFRERFEWGVEGLLRLAPHADVVVVVDVLSFATAVDVAVGRGAIVYPFSERGAEAANFARRVDAVLAGDRSAAPAGRGYSLSPVSLQTIPSGTRLVLPSPNGATLVTLASKHSDAVLLGCLRNASAVAACCRTFGAKVAVIAAGERWSHGDGWSGVLRPAVEDLIGAGAILAALSPRDPSPEAVAAMAAFQAAADDLPSFLAACSSGKELIERGFASDVTLAAQHNVSRSVPWLQDERLESWSSPEQQSTMECEDSANGRIEPSG
jgi:2-phosphosulfolactate phosphatase